MHSAQCHPEQDLVSAAEIAWTNKERGQKTERASWSEGSRTSSSSSRKVGEPLLFTLGHALIGQILQSRWSSEALSLGRKKEGKQGGLGVGGAGLHD